MWTIQCYGEVSSTQSSHWVPSFGGIPAYATAVTALLSAHVVSFSHVGESVRLCRIHVIAVQPNTEQSSEGREEREQT